MIRQEIRNQMAGGRRRRVPRPHVLGEVAPDYTGGRPMIIMDDDPSRTPIGPFPKAASVSLSPGDRVYLARAGAKGKYIVEDKIE